MRLPVFCSFPQNLWSILWSFCTDTFSINCTCKYSNLIAEERQTLRRWFSTLHLTLPVFISFFMNSKLFFKASGRSKILIVTTFVGYQINNISIVIVQNPLNFIFLLGSKTIKFGETTKKFLQMSHSLLHSFVEHLFCLVVT